MSIRDDQEIIAEEEDDVFLDEDNPDMVFQKLKPNKYGNLIISLFWEEKFILLIKFFQFIGFTLILFYE